MSEYINSHLSNFWIAIGFILLILEVLIFGFSTLIFMFAGIAAVLTGLGIMFGVLPETWMASVSSFGIATGIVGITLWKPLIKMQSNGVVQEQQSSDLIGYEFVLKQNISILEPGLHRYSGVDWKVELDKHAGESLSAGQRVTVTSLEPGVFRVDVVN